MAAELIVAPEAEQDVAEAHAWYESRRIGLGEEFLNCVDSCIEAICRTPTNTSVNIPTLIVPGIGNSDKAHWQTLWKSANPEFIRVQQRDWNHPVCEEWVNGLEQAVAGMDARPLLVARSLGCLCVAHWAARTSLKIKGALLVAPPHQEDGGFPSEAIGFSPLPLGSFKFPSIVVASSNDPYGSLEFARVCATGWGSRFVNIGAASHINSESGLGDWPEGWTLYQELTA